MLVSLVRIGLYTDLIFLIVMHYAKLDYCEISTIFPYADMVLFVLLMRKDDAQSSFGSILYSYLFSSNLQTYLKFQFLYTFLSLSFAKLIQTWHYDKNEMAC